MFAPAGRLFTKSGFFYIFGEICGENIPKRIQQYRQDIVMRIYVSGVNYNVNSNYTKYLTQRNFYVLENFLCKFPKIVAPPTDITTNRLVDFLKSTCCPLTNGENPVQIDA